VAARGSAPEIFPKSKARKDKRCYRRVARPRRNAPTTAEDGKKLNAPALANFLSIRGEHNKSDCDSHRR